MRLEPLVQPLIASGRLYVDLMTGLIFSTRSNTPDKPLGALTAKGYLRVCISVDGKQAHALAHRIVWIARHGPIPEGVQIDHVDTVKTHNWISNLEAVTGAENMARGTHIMTKSIPICDYCGGQNIRELTEDEHDRLPAPLATCTHFCSHCDGPVGTDDLDVTTIGGDAPPCA